MGRSLSPRDAADLLGITSDTLRRWERNGLIESERTPGGQRRYREEDVAAMLDGDVTVRAQRDQSAPVSARRIAHDAAEEPSTRSSTQLSSWERRVNEERAELEVTKLRHERAALIRAEQLERQEQDRDLAETKRAFAKREDEARKIAEVKARERVRLEGLRTYGRTLASIAPPEYQAKIVRDLSITVNARGYPEEMPDHLSKAAVSTRVDELLKPWHEAQARDRARVESKRTRQELITAGKWHAYSVTLNWERHDADRASREVDRALHAEIDDDWTREDVYGLVDDVLDEWEEDDEDEE